MSDNITTESGLVLTDESGQKLLIEGGTPSGGVAPNSAPDVPITYRPIFSSAPRFNVRVPCQFICTDVPALSISVANGNLLLNNPAIFNVMAGTVAKIDPGVDGLNYFRGDGEYAPFALDLEWNQLGLSDYQKLARLRPYYVHFISYRGIGYYGKLVLDGPKSTGTKVADVLKVKASFLPLAPSDQGGAQAVARLAPPTSFAVQAGTTFGEGFIPAFVSQFYWLTFGSRYGETTPQLFSSTPISGNGSTKNTMTWTWPTNTTKIESASVYTSGVNDVSTARLLATVPYGLAPTWVDYVGFQGTLVDLQPPLVNTAYIGDWYGGIWYNENS